MRVFSDCHFHLLTLKEPDFAAFINSFYDSKGKVLTANATENYLFSRDMNILDTISNLLVPFENPISGIIQLMENDLKGYYTSARKDEYAPLEPYINGGRIHIRGLEFDKMLMIPLLMDFSDCPDEKKRTYYPSVPKNRITPYIEDTVEGIREYYRTSPDGLFEFYPFAGINPRCHSEQFLEDFLSRYINTSHKMHKDHTLDRKPFYGIKIYPPLGFAPWPEDELTREKHKMLYAFCEENQVPIITHADDQGFRGVAVDEAWRYTDPASWRTVLENYPRLRIDFAHFGKQYALTGRGNITSLAMRLRRLPDSPWFLTIISLMEEFENVYADLSFSGAAPLFYSELRAFLDTRPVTRDKLISRILFGSDFSVNLFKVESYTEYLSIYDRSEFTDDEISAIAENTLRFLGFCE